MNRVTKYNCDVAVIGGGPAGLQFANSLANIYDGNITVFEAHDHISKNKKSTGGTFESVINDYDIPDRAIMSKNKYLTFESANRQVNREYKNYVLDFPNFLDVLAQRARSKGVTIKPATVVRKPIVEDGKVVGFTTQKNKSIRAKITVDATGPKAQITSKVGLMDKQKSPHGVGLEYEVNGQYKTKQKMLLRIDHEYSPGGYAWVFPAGKETFKIGICWFDKYANDIKTSPDLKNHLKAWMHDDNRWSIDSIRDVHSGDVYALPRTWHRSVNGLVGIGDAVATISPLFGEGIRTGMESADMAAPVVKKALEQDNRTRFILKEYDQAWNSKNKYSWLVQQVAAQVFYQLTEKQQDKLIDNLRSLTPEEVNKILQFDFVITPYFRVYPFSVFDLPKLGYALLDQLKRLFRSHFQSAPKPTTNTDNDNK